MRKAISSAFILLLLLFSLFGLGAWLLGANTEKSIHAYIADKQLNPDSLFNYELIKYDRSIFGAKAIISVELNLQNKLALFFENIFVNKNIYINVDVFHGPILFNTSGVNIASSFLELHFDDNLLNEMQSAIVKLFKSNQLPTATISIGFKDDVNYRVPLEFSQNKIMVSGKYDLKTLIHSGQLISKQLNYQNNSQQIQLNGIQLNYQQTNNAGNENIQILLTADTPELIYKHNSLSEQIALKVAYQGDVSLKDNTFSSDNKFTFKVSDNKNDSKYPIDKGDLRFIVTALNSDHLLQLNSALSEFNSLQQQIQWIIDEQGEFPEGQDQIWQRQDSVIEYSRQLPELVRKVLNIHKTKNIEKQLITKNNASESRLKFLFNGQYKNQISKLEGAIYPADVEVNDDILEPSFISLIQTEAQVSLGNEWFQFLSAQLPIKKPNFKLIYKQNKLLMQ